jgi:hypothetical protein
VRVIREIEARGGVRRIAADVDPEWTDFPIRRNRTDQEEDEDQPAEEQQQAEFPAPAALGLLLTR